MLVRMHRKDLQSLLGCVLTRGFVFDARICLAKRYAVDLGTTKTRSAANNGTGEFQITMNKGGNQQEDVLR
jgi:hypothetical protein